MKRPFLCDMHRLMSAAELGLSFPGDRLYVYHVLSMLQHPSVWGLYSGLAAFAGGSESLETVSCGVVEMGNSWDILNAILGHKYHKNHSNRVISSE